MGYFYMHSISVFSLDPVVLLHDCNTAFNMARHLIHPIIGAIFSTSDVPATTCIYLITSRGPDMNREWCLTERIRIRYIFQTIVRGFINYKSTIDINKNFCSWASLANVTRFVNYTNLQMKCLSATFMSKRLRVLLHTSYSWCVSQLIISQTISSYHARTPPTCEAMSLKHHSIQCNLDYQELVYLAPRLPRHYQTQVMQRVGSISIWGCGDHHANSISSLG